MIRQTSKQLFLVPVMLCFISNLLAMQGPLSNPLAGFSSPVDNYITSPYANSGIDNDVVEPPLKDAQPLQSDLIFPYDFLDSEYDPTKIPKVVIHDDWYDFVGCLKGILASLWGDMITGTVSVLRNMQHHPVALYFLSQYAVDQFLLSKKYDLQQEELDRTKKEIIRYSVSFMMRMVYDLMVVTTAAPELCLSYDVEVISDAWIRAICDSIQLLDQDTFSFVTFEEALENALAYFRGDAWRRLLSARWLFFISVQLSPEDCVSVRTSLRNACDGLNKKDKIEKKIGRFLSNVGMNGRKLGVIADKNGGRLACKDVVSFLKSINLKAFTNTFP